MITNNRFDDHLRETGLIGKGQKGILNIIIRDPGGNLTTGYPMPKNMENLPLTVMARNATAGRNGSNFEGYRDYRGVPVFGVWLWDNSLGFGLTTEIDSDEALQTFLSIRTTLLIVLAVTVLMAMLLTGLSIWIGRRANLSLRIAKNEAELANRSKTDFLANISHELHTPLNTIIGFSDMVKGELFGPLENATYKENISVINDSGNHLLKLFGDLIDISKIETGVIELNEETFDVNPEIMDSIKMVLVRAQEESIDIQTNLMEKLPKLRADRLRVKQVVLNLLNNAIRFSLSGSEITLKSSVAENGGIILSVSDTGIGIAA